MKRVRLSNMLDQALLLIKTSNNNSGQFNRVLCIAVVVGYLISWSSVAYDALVSKPGTVLPPRFHIWTLFSAPLVENHLLVLLFNVLFILTLGKVVTPLWGDVESIIYFAVVNVSTITVCSLSYLILYILRGDLHYLYYVRIHGLTSYIIALSVAVKQVMPEQVVLKLPNDTKIRNRNIPLCLVCLSVVLWLTRLEPSEFMLMAFSGWISGFVYLRYFQKHTGGFLVGPGGQSVSDRGDLSDAFSFATFFPKALQPAMQALSTACFDLLVTAKICRKPIRRYAMGQPLEGIVTGSSDGQFNSAQRVAGGLSISVSSAGGVPLQPPNFDEERRRQIAVKALSERLPTAGATSLPATSPLPPTIAQSGQAAFHAAYSSAYAAPAAPMAVGSYYNPATYSQPSRYAGPPSTSAASYLPLAQSGSDTQQHAAMAKFLSPVTLHSTSIASSEQQRPASLPPPSIPLASQSTTIPPASLPTNFSSASLNSSLRATAAVQNIQYSAEAADEMSAARPVTESSSPSDSLS